MADADAQIEPTPVWDLAVRLFHWSLVGLVVLAWRTAETRDLSLHRLAGSAVVGLIVFRLWWGLVGSSTARFSSFVKGPSTVLAYARTLLNGKAATGEVDVGHNPMGGWSVTALLACLGLLTAFGLFSVDTDGLESGPLAALVSFDLGRQASKLHALLFDVLEGLVGAHILAIAFYALIKRQNLIGPMVTGRKRLSRPAPPLERGSRGLLLAGLSVSIALTAYLAHLGGAF